jgi:glyoxalase/bleomycin resistance protein/dioxygenase superfamily protein
VTAVPETSPARQLSCYLGRPPDQLGFVTVDLAGTVAALTRAWGWGPWDIHEYTSATLRHRNYRGTPGQFESRNAVAPGGRVGVVQPLTGPSVHTDALRARGPGLAYLSWFVHDLGEVAEHMAHAGIAEAMRGGGYGLDGDGEFVYYDTSGTLGLYSQYTVAPARRRSPIGRLEER